MNAGTDQQEAVKQAHANAKTDNQPRYVHRYNGVYWIEKKPPDPLLASTYLGSDYLAVHPDGHVVAMPILVGAKETKP